MLERTWAMTPSRRAPRPARLAALALATGTCMPALAHASLLSGEALDTAANVIAWLALLIVPAVLITVFWLVHILPEKIAHKRRHPQLQAIKTLCLLSLFFGGLLWPLAWLWAYTRPVLHKMAYGTDVDDHDHDDHDAALSPFKDAKEDPAGAPQPAKAATTAAPAAAATPSSTVAPSASSQAEIEELRRRLRALEMAVAMTPGPGRAKDPSPTDDNR